MKTYTLTVKSEQLRNAETICILNFKDDSSEQNFSLATDAEDATNYTLGKKYQLVEVK